MFGSSQPVGTSRLQAVLGLVSPVPQAHPPQIVGTTHLRAVLGLVSPVPQAHPPQIVLRYGAADSPQGP